MIFMNSRKLLCAFVLSCCSLPLQAQLCPLFSFPDLSVCNGDDCSILINLAPSGVVRVLPDNEYGDQLGINFGPNSVFNLGDFGRMNFGNTGGLEAVYPNDSPLVLCRTIPSGLAPYIVEMAFGGWFDLSQNNRMEFNENNVLVLGSGSKIDGRLDIQTEGSVGLVSSSGDVTIPNVDISAEQGINVSVQGSIELGNLDNSSTDDGSSSGGNGSSGGNSTSSSSGGTSSGSSSSGGGSSGGGSSGGNTGININAGGDVIAGNVNSDSDLRIATTTGNITIAAIEQANTISLLIDSPDGGTITIGDSEISGTDGPVGVECSTTEDCNDFSPTPDQSGGGDGSGGGGGANDPCNPDNLDPNQPNACGGGSLGFPFLFLLLLLAIGREKIGSRVIVR